MADQDTIKTKVFRFKYSSDILPYMIDFSNIHKLDDRVTYKEAWAEWCSTHTDMISREYRRQCDLGFDQDLDVLLTKMYNSVRYYYSKKSNKVVEPKKRRKYVRINKDIIKMFDTFIQENASTEGFKPSSAFKECMEVNYYDFENEKENLRTNYEMEDMEIMTKLKKTFNNRYYLFSKKK